MADIEGEGWGGQRHPPGRRVRPGPATAFAEGDVVRLAVGADGHARLGALLAEEATREEAGREVAG